MSWGSFACSRLALSVLNVIYMVNIALLTAAGSAVTTNNNWLCLQYGNPYCDCRYSRTGTSTKSVTAHIPVPEPVANEQKLNINHQSSYTINIHCEP